MCCSLFIFFFQAEDGIRDLVRSRGLGDVYKRQALDIDWKGTDTTNSTPTSPFKYSMLKNLYDNRW
mgnify:CR=1 FL=1